MSNTIKGILLGCLLISIGWGVYLNYFKIPQLEKTIYEYENTPPKVEYKYLPGKVDTLVLYDTLTVHAPISGIPEQYSPVEAEPEVKKYRTSTQDSILMGTIYNTVIGDGYLADAKFTYQFRKPIYTTQQIDTVIVSKTHTLVKFKPAPKTIRLQAGVMAGANPYGDIYFGPSIGLLNRNDDSFSYSYDVLNNGHYVTYRRTLRFPKINLNPFK